MKSSRTRQPPPMINTLNPGQMHPLERHCNLPDIILAMRNIKNDISKANSVDSLDLGRARESVGNVGYNDCDIGSSGDGLAWWLVNNVRIDIINIGCA